MRDLLPFVLDTLFEATALLVVAALAATCVRRYPALRHAIWGLALVAILSVPALERISLPHPVATWTLPASWNSPAVTAGSVDDNVGPAEPSPQIRPPLRGVESAAAVAFLVWLVGVAMVLLQAGLAIAHLRSLESRSEPVADGEPLGMLARSLAESMGIPAYELRRSLEPSPAVALTWGFRRPVLLLPQGAGEWGADRRRIVLLHELAHIRHRDYLWRMIAASASALYWFHPLVWFAIRQLRLTEEEAADAQVVNHGVEPPTYAQELIMIAAGLCSRRLEQSGALPIVGQSQLGRRIRTVLDPSNRRAPLRASHSFVLGLSCAGALGLVLMCGPVAQSGQPLSAGRMPFGAAEGASASGHGMPLPGRGWPGEQFPATRLEGMVQQEIDGMNFAQARYAVNEAYARHGVTFRRKPIREQFVKMTWYRAVPGRYEEGSHHLLTDIEKTNVDRLEDRLSRLKSPGEQTG